MTRLTLILLFAGNVISMSELQSESMGLDYALAMCCLRQESTLQSSPDFWNVDHFQFFANLFLLAVYLALSLPPSVFHDKYQS